MCSWKLFVGGLSWESSEASLRAYFGTFGAVSDVVIMRDRHSGHPRGFGFVSYASEAVAERVAAGRHELDGRCVEAKRAVPRSECAPVTRGHARATKKVFVGGLPAGCGDREFFDYFGRFGEIGESQVMYDFQTRNSRGFGFVTFGSEATVERVVGVQHEILGKMVEVKRAEPKQVLEARRASPETPPAVPPVAAVPAPTPRAAATRVVEGGPEYAAVAAAAVALRREQSNFVHVQAAAAAQLQAAQIQIRHLQQAQAQVQQGQDREQQLRLPTGQSGQAGQPNQGRPAGLSVHHLREQHALLERARRAQADEELLRRQATVSAVHSHDAAAARAISSRHNLHQPQSPMLPATELATASASCPSPALGQGSLLAPFAPTTPSPWASLPATDVGLSASAGETSAGALLFPPHREEHRQELSLEHQLEQLSVSRQHHQQLTSSLSPTHTQNPAVPLHKLGSHSPTAQRHRQLVQPNDAAPSSVTSGMRYFAPSQGPPVLTASPPDLSQFVGSSSVYGSSYTTMGSDLFGLPQAVASSGRGGGTEQLQPLSLSHNLVDRVDRSSFR